MSYRVAVIGAGYYGCHIALSLAGIGFSVKVFEQHNKPLHEASGNNQFRLHLGFHYARHYGTRMQSRDGFMRFIERYPDLSGPVAENIYAVPRSDSLVDFPTYRLVMTASGIDFTEASVSSLSVPLTNIDGCLLTSERVLYLERARAFFKKRLGSSLELGHRVQSVQVQNDRVWVEGERFDLLIDASWGHFQPVPMDVYYEPTMLLYYETDEPFPALTMVDGPLCSIYPTEDPRIFTLSSVVHTPLGQFKDVRGARMCRESVDKNVVWQKKNAMEEQIKRYLPDFSDRFSFVGPQLSMKTKPIGRYDDRSCYVHREGPIFSIMSGKIDTVFYATERILSMIEASYDSEFEDLRSTIKDDAQGVL